MRITYSTLANDMRWNLANDRRKPYYPGMALNSAYVPGTDRRFLVEKFSADDFGTPSYRLRDAAKVTDAEVRAGKASPVVGSFRDLRALATWFADHVE